ncbi:hypothetical protein [Symbiopectobacterium sp. RP]|uniref:hypothetical protein n=1 Tax=Symbiopectobacterium sp. RP TaxID=3248553 RepID=UPI003D27ECD7
MITANALICGKKIQLIVIKIMSLGYTWCQTLRHITTPLTVVLFCHSVSHVSPTHELRTGAVILFWLLLYFSALPSRAHQRHAYSSHRNSTNALNYCLSCRSAAMF